MHSQNAIKYHYNKFPPSQIDYAEIINALAKATDAIARYDQMLKNMHNSEIFLAPLRSQEAVISSRMEGTISNMDEILRYKAEEDQRKVRGEVVETALYAKSLKKAQQWVEEGKPINSFLLRSLHKELLSFGRGFQQSPGEFKNQQNYIADKIRKEILFIPISPNKLNDGLESLFFYMQNSTHQPLIKTAISHLELEALHPFKDGNGRVGRMLITLFLYKQGVISAPHFYISGYLEERKQEYLNSMRQVSATDSWTPWCLFFLKALEAQAMRNLVIAQEIQGLYQEMKSRFRKILATQWHVTALDFLFTRPVFKGSTFSKTTPIPINTAQKFIKSLLESNLLEQLEPPSGRRPGLYSFEPLMSLIRV